MRQIMRSRAETSILRHTPLSKARRAARTARSTSSALASGTVVSCSPVAGFITGMLTVLEGLGPLAVDVQLVGL